MPVVSEATELQKIGLFCGLTAPDLAELNGLLHRRVVRAGANVLLMDQPGDRVYFIWAGTLKAHIEQADGTEVIIFIRGPGETVGEMSLIDHTYPSANVVALEPSVLFWMDGATFAACRRRMADLNDNLVRLLSDRVRYTTRRLVWLTTHSVEGRLARQLLAFAEQCGVPDGAGGLLIPLRLTQSDLASLVGASRESVNKVIVALKARGTLAVDPAYRITVGDRAALAALCE